MPQQAMRASARRQLPTVGTLFLTLLLSACQAESQSAAPGGGQQQRPPTKVDVVTIAAVLTTEAPASKAEAAHTATAKRDPETLADFDADGGVG